MVVLIPEVEHRIVILLPDALQHTTVTPVPLEVVTAEQVHLLEEAVLTKDHLMQEAGQRMEEVQVLIPDLVVHILEEVQEVAMVVLILEDLVMALLTLEEVAVLTQEVLILEEAVDPPPTLEEAVVVQVILLEDHPLVVVLEVPTAEVLLAQEVAVEDQDKNYKRPFLGPFFKYNL